MAVKQWAAAGHVQWLPSFAYPQLHQLSLHKDLCVFEKGSKSSSFLLHHLLLAAICQSQPTLRLPSESTARQ